MRIKDTNGIKFRPGDRCLAFKQEERLFLLKWAKTLKPKTELEKRIVRRLLVRLMGHAMYYPLYPRKECPHCDREVAGQVYDTHVIRCEIRKKKMREVPEIDPVVWEMMK